MQIQTQIVKDHVEPESLLFMAFALGMLDHWREADELARLSLTFHHDNEGPKPSVIRTSEVLYFRAIATRRLAEKPEQSVEERVRLLATAFGFIRQAIKLKRTESGDDGWMDARYLKKLATLVLRYHTLSAKAGRPIVSRAGRSLEVATRPSEISEESAVELLDKALIYVGCNRRLKVEILNNVAYQCTNAKLVPLEKAESYVERIRDEFREADVDDPRQLPSQPWPAIQDTIIMVEAMRARVNGDTSGLRKSLVELEALCREDLPSDERAPLEENVHKVRQWLTGSESGRIGNMHGSAAS
jgi:hypothetical protein